MVPTWLKKFLNGPTSFWDLFSSYLAQSSYLVRNINTIFQSTSRHLQIIHPPPHKARSILIHYPGSLAWLLSHKVYEHVVDTQHLFFFVYINSAFEYSVWQMIALITIIDRLVLYSRAQTDRTVNHKLNKWRIQCHLKDCTSHSSVILFCRVDKRIKCLPYSYLGARFVTGGWTGLGILWSRVPRMGNHLLRSVFHEAEFPHGTIISFVYWRPLFTPPSGKRPLDALFRREQDIVVQQYTNLKDVVSYKSQQLLS